MGKLLYALLTVIIAIVVLGFVAGWFVGVPYVAFLLVGKTYTFWLSIWFGILLVSNIYRRIQAQNRVGQLEEVIGVRKK